MPSVYSWPLAAPPAPSTPPADTTVIVGAGRPIRGILTPFRRGAADFEQGTGLALISSEIRQVLGTRCSSSVTQGELLWRTDFGSLIEHARHRNNDAVLASLLNHWAVDAIAKWLKNVRVTRTELERAVGPEGEENIAALRIWWEAISRGGQVLGEGETSVPLTSIARP